MKNHNMSQIKDFKRMWWMYYANKLDGLEEMVKS